MNCIAYYRVSTQKQGRSGLGLEAQREIVEQYVKQNNAVLLGAYTEVESGRKRDRPELAKAQADCKRQGATLVIAKLDRLARNVLFIAQLMESETPFVACDLPAATPFMLHVYAAVAEQEARIISERIRAALAVAKSRGAQLGAPVEALRAHAKRRHDEAVARSQANQARQPLPGETVRAFAARVGISVSTAWKHMQRVAE